MAIPQLTPKSWISRQARRLPAQVGSLCLLTSSLSTTVNAVKGLTREEMVECLVSPLRDASDFLLVFVGESQIEKTLSSNPLKLSLESLPKKL